MPYRLACAKLMPGCDFKAEAATEEELRASRTSPQVTACPAYCDFITLHAAACLWF
jgi:hypothetical protein